LHDPQCNKQDRRCNADRLIGRKHAETDRAKRHQEDGEHQRCLPALGIAEAADHDASQGPRQETDAVGCECGEERSCRIAAREELGRNERGEIGVHAEVVPLEQVANRCSQDRLLRLVRQLRNWRTQNSFCHWIVPRSPKL